MYLEHIDLKKHFKLTKVNKKLSKDICRQLKYHQDKIRTEIGVSLEVILKVFKCLIVWQYVLQ